MGYWYKRGNLRGSGPVELPLRGRQTLDLPAQSTRRACSEVQSGGRAPAACSNLQWAFRDGPTFGTPLRTRAQGMPALYPILAQLGWDLAMPNHIRNVRPYIILMCL